MPLTNAQQIANLQAKQAKLRQMETNNPSFKLMADAMIELLDAMIALLQAQGG